MWFASSLTRVSLFKEKKNKKQGLEKEKKKKKKLQRSV